MKQWISYFKEYKRDAFLTPFYVVLEVIVDILIPFYTAKIIDEGIAVGNMNRIIELGVVVVIMCVISIITGYLAGRHVARASTGFAKNLRQAMYYKIQDFSFSNIDKFSTTGLVTRLTTDVSNIQQAVQMLVRTCARAPLMLIFSVVMVYTLNPGLSLIYLATVPVLAIGLLVIIKHAHPIFQKVFKLYDRLNTVVQENLRGIRVVKSFVREEHEIEKFHTASDEVYQNFVRAEKILAFNNPLMQFSAYASIILICWFGAQMIISDTLTTGQLMSSLTYTMQILMSLMILSMVLVMITMARSSAERIQEVLAEKSTITNKENPVMAVADGSIDFNKVNFGYRGASGVQCLQEIDLHIQAGQTVGIVGGTGSGKSSLVQLIPRLYDVTAGSIAIGGVDVRDYDIEVLRDEVSMVLQNNTLFSGTIKDNLRWGKKDATDAEMQHVCELAQADEFIQGFPDKYDTHIDQGGSNVSGGQKQRLCIARALLKNPKILILDDSTSAVDTKTDASIRKAFRDEIPNTTKIIIAQRISSIEDADQIIVMDRGGISAVGTHDELLIASNIYREVYESQQKGGLEQDV